MYRTHSESSNGRVAAFSVLFVAMLSAPGLAASAVNINLSTGLSASGTVQNVGGAPDAYWTIDGQPARVVTPSNPDWFAFWPANDAGSAWIAKDPASNGTNGLGTYSRVFDLTGADLSTVQLTGTWTVDDQGPLALNGHVIAALGWNEWQTGFRAFSVTDRSWFNSGLNTLTISITTTDTFFEGVRLSGSVSAAAAVPVPPGAAAGALLLGGLAARRANRHRPRFLANAAAIN